MDAIAQQQEIVMPPTTQSILIGRSVFFGGFVAVVLFLGIASHFSLSWIERSSPATDIGMLGLALFFAIPLIPTAWEALDRSPVMVVDGNGVKLHPCFGIPALKWDDIKGSDITEWSLRGGTKSVLTIFMARRSPSWNRPFGRDKVTIAVRKGTDSEELLVTAMNIINATASA
ncbi:hypothetical protein H7F51_13340 [Novosphingobium flavum]|uniref:PH domain-containing protein n=1 Tax=Novosphingobium flavum TaxID=1778672 RepID=A0A7X1KMD2_9SPHN|nr:hypothetical protein [Novosphingobium flavum]MBC2666506.1 hypothetical protein [Novosphingobium flavum]